MLLLSAFLAVAGGVTSSAIVIANSNLIIIGSSALALFLVLQILVTFVLKSEDEKELLLLRQIRLQQLEREISESAALESRIQQEIREGNLQSALEWAEFRRRLR